VREERKRKIDIVADDRIKICHNSGADKIRVGLLLRPIDEVLVVAAALPFAIRLLMLRV